MNFHSEAWIEASLHPAVAYATPMLFVVSVYSFAGYMKTKKEAFQVKLPMQLYNVAQIVVCSYMVWGLMPVLGFPNLFGINSECDQRGEWFMYVHYLSKFLDWFDTLWILAKKNRAQLSFLHVYHHATVGMLWGYVLRNGAGCGTLRYAAWANSLTHMIMYSHYLWTSFGLKNPFKKYITMFQIGQFWFNLVHSILICAVETTRIGQFSWLETVYNVQMIYLFTFKLSWVPSWTPAFGKADSSKAMKKVD